jgi:hypothetical protein
MLSLMDLSVDLSDCLYVADMSKLYFVPYCEGDIRGGCNNCKCKVCSGFWAGDNRSAVDNDESTEQPNYQDRSKRVDTLAAEYAKYTHGWDDENSDLPSPLDYLPIPVLEPSNEGVIPDPYILGLRAALPPGRKPGPRPQQKTVPPEKFSQTEADEWRGGYCEGKRLVARFPKSA